MTATGDDGEAVDSPVVCVGFFTDEPTGAVDSAFLFCDFCWVTKSYDSLFSQVD
jgi:hypothetical protein